MCVADYLRNNDKTRAWNFQHSHFSLHEFKTTSITDAQSQEFDLLCRLEYDTEKFSFVLISTSRKLPPLLADHLSQVLSSFL
mgnify:CR=1 FL=1